MAAHIDAHQQGFPGKALSRAELREQTIAAVDLLNKTDLDLPPLERLARRDTACFPHPHIRVCETEPSGSVIVYSVSDMGYLALRRLSDGQPEEYNLRGPGRAGRRIPADQITALVAAMDASL